MLKIRFKLGIPYLEKGWLSSVKVIFLILVFIFTFGFGHLVTGMYDINVL